MELHFAWTELSPETRRDFALGHVDAKVQPIYPYMETVVAPELNSTFDITADAADAWSLVGDGLCTDMAHSLTRYEGDALDSHLDQNVHLRKIARGFMDYLAEFPSRAMFLNVTLQALEGDFNDWNLDMRRLLLRGDLPGFRELRTAVINAIEEARLELTDSQLCDIYTGEFMPDMMSWVEGWAMFAERYSEQDMAISLLSGPAVKKYIEGVIIPNVLNPGE